MLDPGHFRSYIVRPTLEIMDLPNAQVAEDLLVGTALVESKLRFLRQIGGGPALGFYQIEPATHDDLWNNYLHNREPLNYRARGLLAPRPSELDQLVTNPAYATAIARLIYWRRPEPLPETGDVLGYAAYWKAHFNTEEGAGEENHFIETYERYGT